MRRRQRGAGAAAGRRRRDGWRDRFRRGPLLQEKHGSPLTSGLALLAIKRAGHLAGGIPGSRAVPVKPLGRSFGSLFCLTAALAIAAVCLPRLAWTQWLRFTDPFGDHPPFSRVLYEVEPGDVQVVYGSGLDIRVTTEGAPVDRLSLILQNPDDTGEETLPMFPEPGGEWRATVTNITAPGRYFVRSHAGRSCPLQHRRPDGAAVGAVRFRITPPAYTNRPPTKDRCRRAAWRACRAR